MVEGCQGVLVCRCLSDFVRGGMHAVVVRDCGVRTLEAALTVHVCSSGLGWVVFVATVEILALFQDHHGCGLT